MSLEDRVFTVVFFSTVISRHIFVDTNLLWNTLHCVTYKARNCSNHVKITIKRSHTTIGNNPICICTWYMYCMVVSLENQYFCVNICVFLPINTFICLLSCIMLFLYQYIIYMETWIFNIILHLFIYKLYKSSNLNVQIKISY